MNTEEDYLLQLAELHLKKAKGKTNKKSNIDYRISTFAIVNYYNFLLLKAGNELKRDIKESYNFERKLFIVSQELPKLLTKYESLFETIDYLRQKVSHTDISIPKENKLNSAIEQAKEFKSFLGEIIHERRSIHKKKLSLKEKYKEKIEFVKLWFEYPDKRFKENLIKQSEKIKNILTSLEYYEKIDIEQLDDKSIESLLHLVNRALKEAELIYEKVYNFCPKCGGRIIVTSEQKTQYTGPYDDPEPYSFTVWQVIKCENCGEIIEKEHITTEYI